MSKTQTTELSVIVTAHNETAVTGPTMNAAHQSIATARDAGISVERIIAFDNATPETREWFAQFEADGWQLVTVDQGDLGRTRNHIIEQARGKYIAFLDADDLFSKNWLLNGIERLRKAEQAGEQVIVHPELNWLFDGASSVFLKPDQDDPLFTPYHFYFNNYYDSLALVPRAAHLRHPYLPRDIENGLSFQDWQFSIDSMAGGWKHVSARDTIIFKRRRDASLVTESRSRRAIIRVSEAMAIDKVKDLGGPRRVVPRSVDLPDRKSVSTGRALPGLRRPDPSPEHLPPNAWPTGNGQVPHYGQAFADRVEVARALIRTRGMSKIHTLIRPHFDYAFYLAENSDIARNSSIDPVRHYIRAGAKEGRDPSPLFSTKAYLARYPDVKASGVNPFYHWLTKGWSEGRIGAPATGFSTLSALLEYDPLDSEALWSARYRDLRQRLEYGALGAQVAFAAAHDPLVEHGWRAALAVKIAPFNNQNTVTRTNAIHDLQVQAGQKPARFVICVNKPRWGGAKRLEGNIANALAAGYSPDQVLLITTEQGGRLPKGRLPEGVRQVDFARAAANIQDSFRPRLLVEFVRSLGAEVLFNINSRLMWEALTPFGKALSTTTRIIGCFLCNEQNPLGHWSGYPLVQFYRHFDMLDQVLTDSHFLADELVSRYRVPKVPRAKIRVLSNPVDPDIPALPAPAQKARPQVFWAGRLDPQKRVDLVFAIAAAMPDVDFRLWGNKVMDSPTELPPKPANVTFEGTYGRLDELPLKQADLWLYTSAWDGVPQMLLEVAMAGVPLVGTLVGGTDEVLREGLTIGLDPDQAQVADWQDAIGQIITNPDAFRDKARQLRQILVQERTAKRFQASILEVVRANDL